MKRYFLLILSFISFSIPLLSQNFNGGVLLGADVSQLDGDNYGGYNKIGLLGGGFVSLDVSDHSSFQLEMEYIQKGSKAYDTLGNDFRFHFHYLEIPLLYQYSLGKRFSFEAGPAADVLLGSLEESSGVEVPSTIPLRKITLVGIYGGSYFLTPHLKLNIRVNYSLLSIRETGSKYTYPPGYRKIFFEKGQYNNVLSLSLLWYFKEKEF